MKRYLGIHRINITVEICGWKLLKAGSSM